MIGLCGGNDMKLTRSFQNEIDWNTLITWTVHLVMDELPSWNNF